MRLRRTLFLSSLLVFGALLLLVALMDWNWLRGPAQRLATSILQREVVLGHLHVRPGLTSVVRLRDVRLANAEWSDMQPMATAREVEFSIRLASILSTSRVLPHVRLTDADILLERLADGRANWELGRGGQQGIDDGDRPPAVEVRGLRVDGARFGYRDAQLDIRADARAQTRNEARYPTWIEFAGEWDGAPFSGLAQAGDVLSVMNSEQPFALKLSMKAGRTTLEAEGEITDIATLRRIDMQLMIAGPSLASLYPTLKLALPASPPYRFDGRLTKRGNTYGYASFSGTVGGSDIAGDGELVVEEPRPRLSASLRSKRVNLADLGPLIGVEAAEAALSRGAPPERATPGERRRGMRPDDGGRGRSSDGKAHAKKTSSGASLPESVLRPTHATAGDMTRHATLHPVSQPHSPRSWMPAPRPDRDDDKAADPGDEKKEPSTVAPRTRDTQRPSPAARASPDRGRSGDAAPAGPSKARSKQVDTKRVDAKRADVKRGDAQRGDAKRASTPTATARAEDDTGSRVLPTADFSGERLGVIDADINYAIDSLRLPAPRLALRDVRSRALLQDAQLRIDPLRLQFAGGEVLGSLVLDGRVTPNRMRVALDLRRLSLAQLVGPVDKLGQSGGRVGAQLRLAGRGASVADVLGSADGAITLGMAGGQISHLVLAAASLNGGRLLQLALGGDQPSTIRCAAMALNIDNGVGNIEPLVFDTEHVRIDGDGQLNFKTEQFALELRPQPKAPNALSVRGPLHVRGSFTDVDIALDSSVAARAGAAVALALVNPLAALIPLIETGGGEDSHCGEVLAPVAGAAQQAKSGSTDVPDAQDAGRDAAQSKKSGKP